MNRLCTVAWIAAAAGLCCASRSDAHSVSISRGRLIVHADRLQLDLTIPADDLLHTYRPPPYNRQHLAATVVDTLVERYAQQLLREITIRDAYGEALQSRLASSGHDLGTGKSWPYDQVRKALIDYTLEYPLQNQPSHLTLQQTFFSGGASHAAQLCLAAGTPTDPQAVNLQLTNRGNAEVLELDWRANAPRIASPSRFKDVTGEVSIENARISVENRIPLLLLETWQSVDRCEPARITADEQLAAVGPLKGFFAGHNALRAEGARLAPEIESIQFLRPDGSAGRHEPHPLNAALAVVVAKTSYRTARPAQLVELNWDLFNGAVFDVDVALNAGGDVQHHTLTAYHPQLRWSRGQARQAGATHPVPPPTSTARH